MELDDLIKIRTIIEAGSINRAAEILYTAQPALSRCVKKTENEYGITLFRRSQGKKITLTEEGEMFYNALKEILLVDENLRFQIRRHQERDERRIIFGTATQQSVFLFGDMVVWFYRNEPNYHLDTRSGSSRMLHQAVLDKDIDVALLTVTEFLPGLYYEKNQRMHTNLYLASGSPLIGKRRTGPDGIPILDVHDLDGETVIVNYKGAASRLVFDRLIETYGIHVHLIEEGNMYQRMKLSDEGAGTYVLTSSAPGKMPEWANGDIDRYACIDPSQDMESWRYLICREGYQDTEKYESIRKCLNILTDK